ncbi:MAG TPA: NADH:ubiquinone oxidoreductase, partial [Synergistaceae bacterium]|nr:NADH:ubiquinone oxidoreductase [Synergistaceae bacterium]
MNWQIHLPALALAVPLLGAFVSPVAGLGGRLTRNAWMVLVSMATTAICILLWQRVVAGGTVVYVMGAEAWNITLPSGLSWPIRIILEVDAFSAFMVVVGSIAALAGAFFSLRFMDKFTGLEKFSALFFLLVTGMLG